MQKYFKVKYGYDVMDFISIPEEELPRAIKAWQQGMIYEYDGSMVKGSEIKTITPHYQKYTGWNESYEPKDSDDFKQIEKYCPKGLRDCIENAKSFLLNGGNPASYKTVLLGNETILLD